MRRRRARGPGARCRRSARRSPPAGCAEQQPEQLSARVPGRARDRHPDLMCMTMPEQANLCKSVSGACAGPPRSVGRAGTAPARRRPRRPRPGRPRPRRRSGCGPAPGSAARRPATSALADLRPAVDVEQLDRLQQLTGTRGAARAATAAAGTASSTTSATSSLATGKDEIGDDVAALGRRRDQQVEVQLQRRTVRAGRPNAAHDPRVQLAGVPDDDVGPRQHAARRTGPGARGRPPPRPAVSVEPDGRGRHLDQRDRLRPAGRPPGRPTPAGARTRSAPQPGAAAGRRARRPSPRAPRVGPPVDRRAGCAGAGAGGEEHRAGLEQRQVVVARGWCCGPPRRTAGQQRSCAAPARRPTAG